MSRYRFMSDHLHRWPVRVMADTLEVSASGFYAWRDRRPGDRDRHRERVVTAVTEIYHEHRGIPGSRKIARELVEREISACRNTVARLMRESGLESRAQRRRRWVRTTDSNHADPIAPNGLGRDFEAAAPNRKWVADITYVETDRGWAYLAVVLDLFSRRVVGWSMSDTLDTSLVLSALDEAIRRRRPDAGLLFHSDRGSQYTSDSHRRRLSMAGIECSMSRRGNCWDNACAERFFCSYKHEWARHERYRDVEEARQDAFRYIEIYYNRQRRHETLGYLSPAEFEEKHEQSNAA
jgi:putative transposase